MLKKLILFVLLNISLSAYSAEFFSQKQEISKELKAKMLNISYKENCPVKPNELNYLTLSYIDYNGEQQIGNLIVHKKIAQKTINIFKKLFAENYPIKSMKLIIEYNGSDDASMADNNSSAFNCRAVAGKDNVFSKHSYGIAIDINPIENPYIKNNVILPPEGKKYLDRTINHPALIRKGDKIYEAFISEGFIWGGEWNSLKDYHHFEYKETNSIKDSEEHVKRN